MRPRLLDLFCGAGGSGVGYHRAGFDVVGVDIEPQPRYPFEFIQADAFKVLSNGAFEEIWWDVSVIHASPPCHDHSSLAGITGKNGTHWLLATTHGQCDRIGLPFVIENVGRANMPNSVTLCGSSFGLGVRRHRKFIVSPSLILVPPCAHHLQPEPLDVTGGGPSRVGRERSGGGVSRKPRNVEEAGNAMGIDWMTRAELNQAVPPAFTEYIGLQLLAAGVVI